MVTTQMTMLVLVVTLHASKLKADILSLLWGEDAAAFGQTHSAAL